MLLTIFLAIVFCAAMALMLISAVAFIQDNKFFSSAPKEAKEALIQRENIHMDHGIFGSPDLDQSGRLGAWLQSKLVVPLLTSFTKNNKNTPIFLPGLRMTSTWNTPESISSMPIRWVRNT